MTDSRPRGVLSPADRRYLAGEADLRTDQSEYDARYRIRERIRHALLDFSLLFEHLAAQDRRQVFGPEPDDRAALTEGIVSAIAFLYLGTEGYDPPRENLFAEGIRRAADREHGAESAFCSVRIDVERPTRDELERIIDCVERGDYHELGEGELRALACLLHRRDRRRADLLDEMKAALDEERE